MKKSAANRAKTTIAFMLTRLTDDKFVSEGLRFTAQSNVLPNDVVNSVRKCYNTSLVRSAGYMLETFTQNQILKLCLDVEETFQIEPLIANQLDFDLGVAVEIERYLNAADENPKLRWVKADPAKWVAFKDYLNFAYRALTCEVSYGVNQFDDYIKQIYPLLNAEQSSGFYFDVLVHDQLELFRMKADGMSKATVTVSFTGKKAISTWLGTLAKSPDRKEFSVRL